MRQVPGPAPVAEFEQARLAGLELSEIGRPTTAERFTELLEQQQG